MYCLTLDIFFFVKFSLAQRLLGFVIHLPLSHMGFPGPRITNMATHTDHMSSCAILHHICCISGTVTVTPSSIKILWQVCNRVVQNSNRILWVTTISFATS